MATIDLFINADNMAELNETTRITLTNVTEDGVPLGGDHSKGASISPLRSVALITITANDEPFGIVTWDSFDPTVTETDGNNVVSLTLVRTAGANGDIAISYMYVICSIFN